MPPLKQTHQGPAAVWTYRLGGYQVLKKWLSYRERAILDCPLKPEEVQHFTDTARRIGVILRVSTFCSTQEEILLLLHNAGETGLSRAEIGKAAMRPDSTITNVLKTLCSPDKRQVVKRSDGQYVLTPNGTKRVQDELSEKLLRWSHKIVQLVKVYSPD